MAAQTCWKGAATQQASRGAGRSMGPDTARLRARGTARGLRPFSQPAEQLRLLGVRQRHHLWHHRRVAGERHRARGDDPLHRLPHGARRSSRKRGLGVRIGHERDRRAVDRGILMTLLARAVDDFIRIAPSNARARSTRRASPSGRRTRPRIRVGGALGALTAATSDNRKQRRADGANQDSSHRRSYLRHGS